ncbi:hypothetical protein BH09PAT1_BH09PAT1_6040 [soil metagenome]
MADMFDSNSYQVLGINGDEVSTFLEGVDYPATKREILDIVYDNGAPDHILEFFNSLVDQEYFDEIEIVSALETLQTSLVS